MQNLPEMNRIKVSKDFFLDEFIPPEMYGRFEAHALMWIRPEIISIAQELRNTFGRTIVNNWSAGGNNSPEEFFSFNKELQKGFFTESGLRLPVTTTGAKYSMHKFGCAADLKFVHVSPDEVRKYIVRHYKSRFQTLGLTRIEKDTPTWLHIDIANTNSTNLIVF